MFMLLGIPLNPFPLCQASSPWIFAVCHLLLSRLEVEPSQDTFLWRAAALIPLDHFAACQGDPSNKISKETNSNLLGPVWS